MEMASTFSASSTSPPPSQHHLHHNFLTCYSIFNSNCNSRSFCSDFSKFHLHRRPSLTVSLRSNSNSKTRLQRRLSAGSGPPSPPDADPPRPPGFTGKLSTFQDRLQIFFAVLFWMSLFFWSSAWDGTNWGRPNKGSRFRR